LAGIYVHIPYCRQVCYYCDFHFSVSLKHKTAMIRAIIKELEMQKDYLNNAEVCTIYFGGGTPSLLDFKDLEQIIDCIYDNFRVIKNPEITLEANPDDLTTGYLQGLIHLKINRLSIGIQSFNDKVLKYLNRRHTSQQSLEAIRKSLSVGIENINIDLIYGIPGVKAGEWAKDIALAIDLNVPHVSAYHLTIENKTVFGYYLRKNNIKPVAENDSLVQYNMLIEKLSAHHYVHYEISNFAKDGYMAVHNSNYWKDIAYLGVGPSAHSYNGSSRQWNLAVNADYIAAVKKGYIPFEKEELTKTMKLNDYILTSLRTMWGTDLVYVAENFGVAAKQALVEKAHEYIEATQLMLIDNNLVLTEQGMFMADGITADLMA
jgi:oxygen-independent coproporphyrinogen III oxidase